jgi:hypothetical protein
MIFQGVAWIGIKPLWQRIVPMLWCWRVLVPTVMEPPGYENVTSQLKKVMLETIEPCAWDPKHVRPIGNGGMRSIATVFDTVHGCLLNTLPLQYFRCLLYCTVLYLLSHPGATVPYSVSQLQRIGTPAPDDELSYQTDRT